MITLIYLANTASYGNNRQLHDHESAEDTLKEAIMGELNDENSHPRVRKPLYEKYYMATRRILESPLANEDKIRLLQLHMELIKKI